MSIKDAGKQFIGLISGIKFAAKIAQKGKAVADALDDDTDGDGFPQFDQLKTMFPVLVKDGKDYALRLKEFALLAFAYFMHIVEAGSNE